MSVKTFDELMNMIKDKVGDATDDETLQFIEDVSDTLNDAESRANDSTDWKTKYETNDKEWREKYKARFFSGSVQEEDKSPEDEEEEPESPKTFDDLFKEG